MANKRGSASNIKMPDVNELFGLGQESGDQAEKVVEVAIGKLYSFNAHPFKVLDDEKMQETVESIREHTCGAYLYAVNGVSSYLPEHFFEKEPWYVRLVLEGEDRLDRNQRAKEQERTVSYSAISKEWEVIGNVEGNPLEYLLHRENRKEMLRCLTERQREAVSLCFFQQKSRKEAARELGVSSPAVSAILLQAARRLRKKYLSGDQAEKAVAVV